MIHVCRVDVGSRHVFDSADGIDDIGSLANAIETAFKIQKPNQILLIGGGEVLDDHKQKLYRLSAGSEASPIYLIDKQNVERPSPPLTEIQLDQITQDIRAEITTAIAMKPSFQTILVRAQLVNKVYDMGKKLYNACEAFYHDQFWQYQGFLALIANLDEFLSSMRKNEETIRDQFEVYSKSKANNKQLMSEMERVIELLDKIRLLPQILSPSSSSDVNSTNNNRNNNNNSSSSFSYQQYNSKTTTLFSSFSSQSICNLTQQSPQTPHSPNSNNTSSSNNNNNNTSTNNTPSLERHMSKIKQLQQQLDDDASNNQTTTAASATATAAAGNNGSVLVAAPGAIVDSTLNLSLLDWIKSFDPQHQLDNVIVETREMLGTFEKNFKWPELLANKSNLINKIENSKQMREIEGLTQRLHDLNELLEKAKNLLAGQKDITDGFMANQKRAASLKDESILYDLCLGHERQLETFKTNHSNLIEITRKVSKAKLELIKVIHSRLNWVMLIQNQMADINFQIQIHFKQLKRLNVRLKLMEQLRRVPKIYLFSLKETLRRQKFSKFYKEFAFEMSALIKRIYDNEMQLRTNFESNIISTSSQHFIINILFGGLSDKVENILNDAALKFDNNLPPIEEADVEFIENQMKAQIDLLFTPNDITKQSFHANTTTNNNNNENLTSSSMLSPSPSASSSEPSPTSSSSEQSNEQSNNGAAAAATTSSQLQQRPQQQQQEATSSSSSSSPDKLSSQPASSDTQTTAKISPYALFDLELNRSFSSSKQQEQDIELIKRLLKYIRRYKEKFIDIDEKIDEKPELKSDELTNSNESSEKSSPTSSLSSSFIRLPRKTQKILNDAISSIRSNLNETKEIVGNYKEKTNDTLKMLIELQKLESEKMSKNLENELKQVEQKHAEKLRERKVAFYESLVESARKFLDEHQSLMNNQANLNVSTGNSASIDTKQEQLDSLRGLECDDDVDKKLANDLADLLKEKNEQVRLKLDELKVNLKTMKNNMNAQNQIQFNEALKRATTERDKQIEDLKLKELGYLDKIKSLESELSKMKLVTMRQAAATSEAIKLAEQQQQQQMPSPAHSNINTKQSTDPLLSTSISSPAAINESTIAMLNDQSSLNLTTPLTADDDSSNSSNSQLKAKLKEKILMEEITKLKKQLSLFTTLPVTNDYETIQLNSCQIDDLVIAVFSEEHGSYKIIHKSSTYLHFVHSAIFKSHEQRLSFKSNNPTGVLAALAGNNNNNNNESSTSNASSRALTSNNQMATSPPISTSPLNDDNFELINNIQQQQQLDVVAAASATVTSKDRLASESEDPNAPQARVVRNSPSDNVDNIFMSEKQPQWFIGRVLVKEFCVARKENNRFRVPSGTRFYRVKLKPYNLN